jgi:methylmalonyl-CoA mutase cobalamin-binding domain/chain
MRALFDGIPLDQMNTSMTINATAMWLLALYLVVAEEQGADVAALSGTTAAVAEDVHCVGLSVLSGGHAELVPDVLARLRRAGAEDIPVVIGGIIPQTDAQRLRAQGVSAVFTPADFDITAIVGRIVEVIRLSRNLPPWPGGPGDQAGVTQSASAASTER